MLLLMVTRVGVRVRVEERAMLGTAVELIEAAVQGRMLARSSTAAGVWALRCLVQCCD